MRQERVEIRLDLFHPIYLRPECLVRFPEPGRFSQNRVGTREQGFILHRHGTLLRRRLDLRLPPSP